MGKYFLIIAFFSTSLLYSQEAISVSGSDATGTGGSLSYTIGQVAFTNYSGTTGSVSAGVQQAYTIFATTGVNATNFPLEASVYPNPTTDEITIAFNELVKGKVFVSIYDHLGKLVMEKNQQAQATLIYSLNSLTPGNYFIKVSVSNRVNITQISKF